MVTGPLIALYDNKYLFDLDWQWQVLP